MSIFWIILMNYIDVLNKYDHVHLLQINNRSCIIRSSIYLQMLSSPNLDTPKGAERLPFFMPGVQILNYFIYEEERTFHIERYRSQNLIRTQKVAHFQNATGRKFVLERERSHVLWSKSSWLRVGEGEGDNKRVFIECLFYLCLSLKFVYYLLKLCIKQCYNYLVSN